MLNIHSFIRESSHYKKLKIDDLLFVEYKCLVEEVKAGIWSDANYFVFVTSGKKMWRSIYNDYVVQTGDSLFVKKGANLVHQYFDEDYCALMVFISDDFIRNFMTRFSNIIRKATDGENNTDAVIRIQLDEYLRGYVSSDEKTIEKIRSEVHQFLADRLPGEEKRIPSGARLLTAVKPV